MSSPLPLRDRIDVRETASSHWIVVIDGRAVASFDSMDDPAAESGARAWAGWLIDRDDAASERAALTVAA